MSRSGLPCCVAPMASAENSNDGDDLDANADSERCRLLEFVERLSATTSSIDMQMLTNKYLQDLTSSSCVFLVPLLPSSEEGLVQVVGERQLAKEIRFSHSTDLEVEQISSNELINDTLAEGFHVLHKDANPELTEIIEMAVGNKLAMLVFDIKNTKRLPTSNAIQQTSLYVCVAGDESYKERYCQQIKDTFRYILGHLSTSFDLFEEKLVRTQCQNLMNIAQRLLSKIGDLGNLLRGVMVEAKNMTKAERCSLFLLDEYTNELVSKVFDGDEATHEIRIAEGQGIAGHVAQTGKLLNIRSAYQHPLFYKGVDERTGFKTRNILCFPICNENRVIGVAQLCNKYDGFHFDKCDEQIATAFSVYCGISIMHSMVHKQMQKSEARQKLSQELLTYHMKVRDEDVESLRLSLSAETGEMPTAAQFVSFEYNPRETDRSMTVRLSMKMFIDLNFMETFKIREEKLARFLLNVQKGYREVPYHNWTHGFSVAHFAFTLLQNLKLVERGYISQLDALSILIATFCHDLDHRGINNTYQVEVKSPLARLYSSDGSVNERHHLSQAICLINEEHSRILDGITQDQFKECIDNLRELILATDLALHFRILNDLRTLTTDNLAANKRKFMSLLMTCCDLSDQARPWATTQKVASLVYQEFFAQGDMERQIGIAPDAMMDRERACVPQIQIDFINSCTRPTFAILASLFPEAQVFVDTIEANYAQWRRMQSNYENCESQFDDSVPSSGSTAPSTPRNAGTPTETDI